MDTRKHIIVVACVFILSTLYLFYLSRNFSSQPAVQIQMKVDHFNYETFLTSAKPQTFATSAKPQTFTTSAKPQTFLTSAKPQLRSSLNTTVRLPEVTLSQQIVHTTDKNKDLTLIFKQWGSLEINFTPLVELYKVKDQYILPMEKDILGDTPLQDIATVANPETSSVEIDCMQGHVFKRGELLKVHLRLRDARGQSVRKGGHYVRAYVADRSRGFSAVANVTDLQNGEYLITCPLMWSGNTTVIANLVRPREYVVTLLRQFQKMKSIRPVLGGFYKNNISQATLCMPIPLTPGSREWCNLTSENGGLPWYCGKPSHPNISCSDWAFSRSPPEFAWTSPVTNAEKNLVREYSSTRFGKAFPSKESLRVAVEEGILSTNKLSCYKRESRDSWTDQSPRGYWEKEVWHHLPCSLSDLNPKFLTQCFQNTTFLILGDSNARAIFQFILTLIRCRAYNYQDPEFAYTLHIPLYCAHDNLSFLIAWHPHAYPFQTGGHDWSIRRVKHSPSYHIDRIPGLGRYVVLVHMYLHFIWSSSHLVRLHVRDVTRAVKDLLQRNPSARVVIRGPHAFSNFSGDYCFLRTLMIIKEEFASLQDKVVLLDGWDMTVPIENVDMHPPNYVVKELTRVFLSHVCSHE